VVEREAPGIDARVEALVRDANLCRMRRQFVEAEERCRAALDLRPDDASALEMLGDLLAEKGSLQEAASTYQRAMAASPGRATLEEKHARLALELGEQQHQRQMAEMLLANPRAASSSLPPRNPLIALALSTLWPGLGQFYNQEFVKGLAVAAGAVLAFVLGGVALLRLVFAMSGTRLAPSGIESVFGLIYGFLWLYSVIDAAVQAQRSSASLP
jgi:tetratricopeptide (TPR) repeat protein